MQKIEIRQPRSYLSVYDVERILEYHRRGVTLFRIARLYNVSPLRIIDILDIHKAGNDQFRRNLSIKDAYDNGATIKDLSKKHSLSRQQIHNILCAFSDTSNIKTPI